MRAKPCLTILPCVLRLLLILYIPTDPLVICIVDNSVERTLTFHPPDVYIRQ